MRSAAGAFCFGTNLVDRRRLRRVVVFLLGVVFLAVVDDLEVCFLVVAALSVHAGAQIARHNKIRKNLFIFVRTLSTVACDARSYGAVSSGPSPGPKDYTRAMLASSRRKSRASNQPTRERVSLFYRSLR